MTCSEPSLEQLQLYVPVSLTLSCVIVSLLQDVWGWCRESHFSTFTPLDESDRSGFARVQCSWQWPLMGETEQQVMKAGFTVKQTQQRLWNIHFSCVWTPSLFILEWQQLLLPWGPSHLMYTLGLFWVNLESQDYLNFHTGTCFSWMMCSATHSFHIASILKFSLKRSQRNIKHVLHTIAFDCRILGREAFSFHPATGNKCCMVRHTAL